ncbi:hypothetical protein [Caloranaerobacter ferrireducens]|uniref:hypothetical protein n=1 Tax=Caloranaerobacter ferrireducens TaxID=1323370 RepID=UPI00159F1352|nr:hypothetical protein [Caloranaerobacter ferrireducens]
MNEDRKHYPTFVCRVFVFLDRFAKENNIRLLNTYLIRLNARSNIDGDEYSRRVFK